MSGKIELNCSLYGWNDENINLSEPMYGHIRHHLINSLTIILGKTDNEIVRSEANKMAEYINFLETRIRSFHANKKNDEKTKRVAEKS